MKTTPSIHAAPAAAGALVAMTLATGPGCSPASNLETAGPTVSSVETMPEAYYGQTVTLRGDADAVYGDYAFLLEEDDALLGPDLLVLTKSPVQIEGEPIEDGDELIVEGEVRPMVVAEIERELSIVLDPEVVAEFEGQPIVVAHAIRNAETMALWTEGALPGLAGEGEGTTETVTLSTYADSPTDYVGVAVEGEARVIDVVSDRAFWLADDQGNRTLAIVREDVPGHETTEIDSGQEIELSGVAMTSSAVDDLTGTLDSNAQEAILGEPAFIAVYRDDVRPLNQG